MGPDDIDEMVLDQTIIRNRKKIEACVFNAQVIQELQKEHGSFCHWYYNLPGDDLTTLQKTLRQTFKFMGPEIARMWLMASGRIAVDHSH